MIDDKSKELPRVGDTYNRFSPSHIAQSNHLDQPITKNDYHNFEKEETLNREKRLNEYLKGFSG